MSIPLLPDTKQRRLMHRDLASRISMLKEALHRYGLTMTANAIERPMQIIGFEIAAQEDGTWPESVTAAMEEGDKCAVAGKKRKR